MTPFDDFPLTDDGSLTLQDDGEVGVGEECCCDDGNCFTCGSCSYDTDNAQVEVDCKEWVCRWQLASGYSDPPNCVNYRDMTYTRRLVGTLDIYSWDTSYVAFRGSVSVYEKTSDPGSCIEPGWSYVEDWDVELRRYCTYSDWELWIYDSDTWEPDTSYAMSYYDGDCDGGTDIDSRCQVNWASDLSSWVHTSIHWDLTLTVVNNSCGGSP